MISPIAEAIAAEMIILAKLVLESDFIGVNPKVGVNTLKDSNLARQLEPVVDASDDVVIKTLFNHYVVYLEWDRPKKYGKRPPIDALKDWASSRGIPTDAETLWKISNAIWRDGNVGRPIFATFDEEVGRAFETDWSDRFANKILTEVDKFFNYGI